jgi:acyl transferase domain-containing protein
MNIGKKRFASKHHGIAEPIAIVGLGCRLPGGVQSPASLWESLINAQDGITAVPTERWNGNAYYSADRAMAGKVISAQGGFLAGIDQFEPEFFGISEAEAPYLDPQHRILLEVTWEAMERAGVIIANLRGRSVGVFIGCFTNDYLHIQFADPYQVGAYTATGAIGTMLAARISHTFDFQGPSMTIDTACSSSLHSVHLACESLRSGDCEVAVAGGSQLNLIPEFNIAETKGGFISDLSQCRMFDAQARGYVRSEAIAVVVLKRLADALACGDPVQAILLGSAMNQDGRTPTISHPNPEAQKEVMLRACARAGVSPDRISYVEAHGTGTAAGDRAEAEAIGTVFRVDPHCSSDLLVGSVKSVIGHTEAAAGICGLMKAALSVKHHTVAPNLHFETPSPAIDFDRLHLRVPITSTHVSDEPMFACVNSFGFGGSNAAAVVRGATSPECTPPSLPKSQRNTFLLPISARSESALRESAQRMDAWLHPPPCDFRMGDLCYTAGARRTHHEFRRAFAFNDLDSLRDQLASFAATSNEDARAASFSGAGAVWVFSGAGNQRYQTGLQLFREEPLFRQVLEQCDEIYCGLAGFSLLDVMRSRSGEEYIQEAWHAHPVTVSIQIGLASLFREWGAEPAAIVGHSLGETAAFHAAGVYSLAETLQLVFARCESLKPLHGSGGLLAVGADEKAISAVLEFVSEDWAVAAVNGPNAITLSVHGPAMQAVRECLTRAGIRCHRLAESFGCHHHHPAIEAAAEELENRVRGLQPRAPQTPLYSTVTAAAVDTPPAPSYWAAHLLETVKLRPVISTLNRLGFRRYLELGPQPTLTHSITATTEQDGVRVFAALHPRHDEVLSVLNSIGGLYEAGENIQWSTLYPSGTVLDLPSYPWRRSSYWREPENSHQHRTRPNVSSLLGERVSSLPPVWRAEITAEQFPFLLDHRIAGEALFPAAGYIDMALCAGEAHFAGRPFVVEDVKFLKAVSLHRASAFFMEFHFDDARGTFAVFATPSLTNRSAQRVAEGRLRSVPRGASFPAYSASEVKHTELTGELLYERFARMRYDYRSAFRGITRAWVNGDEVVCEIELPAGTETAGYSFHPAALDAAFQALLLARAGGQPQSNGLPFALEVPSSIGTIRVAGVPDSKLLVRACVRDTGSGSSGQITILNSSQQPVAYISEFRTRRVESVTHASAMSRTDRCVFQTEWRAHGSGQVSSDEYKSPNLDAAWVILSGSDVGRLFERRLVERGATRVVICAWRPQTAQDARSQLEDLLDQTDRIAGVIHLGNLELTRSIADPFSDGAELCCESLLSVAQTLFKRGENAKLWMVTRGAHQVALSDSATDPFQAASWGLARAIGQREMPRVWGGLLDLSQHCLPSEIETAVDVILDPEYEDQFAVREHDKFVPRLRRLIAPSPAASPQIAFRLDAPYMITGAFGALGKAVARWMVAHGVRHLILPHHRANSTGSAAFVAELESMGAIVEMPALDLCCANRVTAYCDERKAAQKPPIRGVIYCAGRSRDQLAPAIDHETFQNVFRSKAAGAWALHHALRDSPLEHFVLFSSVASVLPNAGMGAYAAANCFLDSLAELRCLAGLPALSIAWGPWEIGMTERGGIMEYLHHAGFECFSVSQGIQLLENLWHAECSRPIALAADWQRISAQNQMHLPILEDVLREPAVFRSSKVDSGFSQTSGEAEPRQQPDSNEERLRNLMAKLLSSRNHLDKRLPLIDQGLDSLGATMLSETLYCEFGLNVDADAFADGLNLADLISRIAGEAPVQ